MPAVTKKREAELPTVEDEAPRKVVAGCEVNLSKPHKTVHTMQRQLKLSRQVAAPIAEFDRLIHGWNPKDTTPIEAKKEWRKWADELSQNVRNQEDFLDRTQALLHRYEETCKGTYPTWDNTEAIDKLLGVFVDTCTRFTAVFGWCRYERGRMQPFWDEHTGQQTTIMGKGS